MKTLVAYFPPLTGRTEVALRPIIGRKLEETPYPTVIGTFESDDELEKTINQLRSLRLDTYLVVKSDDSPAAGVARDAAIEHLKNSEDWKTFLEDFQCSESDVSLAVREHPFCWIVLAEVNGAGIPPGTGYLLDKQTGNIFPRRFIDVMDEGNQ